MISLNKIIFLLMKKEEQKRNSELVYEKSVYDFVFSISSNKLNTLKNKTRLRSVKLVFFL